MLLAHFAFLSTELFVIIIIENEKSKRFSMRFCYNYDRFGAVVIVHSVSNHMSIYFFSFCNRIFHFGFYFHYFKYVFNYFEYAYAHHIHTTLCDYIRVILNDDFMPCVFLCPVERHFDVTIAVKPHTIAMMMMTKVTTNCETSAQSGVQTLVRP